MKKFFKAKKSEFETISKINHWLLKQKKILMLLFLVVFSFSTVYYLGFGRVAHAAPATYYAIANGNWTVNTTWSLSSGGLAVAPGVWPVAGDTVFIGDAAVPLAVTIPSGYSAACASIDIGNGGSNIASSLTLADGTASLVVSGVININRPGGGSTSALNVNAGTVTVVGTVTLAGTNTSTNRISKIAITTGTLSISGNLVFNTGSSLSNILDMSGGAGNLNLAGSFTVTDGTLTPGGNSTFNFNGTSAQTIPIGVSSIVYNNLRVNNTNVSGATLSAAITSANVTGSLSVQSGTFNNGGWAIALAANKNLSVSNGATFNLTGTSTMATVSGTGTKTFGATSTVNYAGAAQTVTAETYGNLTFSGSGNKTTAAGTTTVIGNWDVGTGTTAYLFSNNSNYTVTGNLTGAGNITSGTGTISLAGNCTNSGTFIHGSGTFVYSTLTGGQTVCAYSNPNGYNILTLSNTSGIDTAGGVITATTLNTTANGTLNMVTYDLGATNVASAGIIRTQSISATPLPTGKTWGGTVNYDTATGGQTVMAGTYSTLTMGNTSGTQTASGAITATTLNTTSGGTLDMATYDLVATNVTSAGNIRTQSTSLTPLPTGKTWGGTVDYYAATGVQKVMAGTYNILTLSNTSGTDTASGAITATTLNTTAGGTLDMVTYDLGATNVTSAGNIKTQSISLTPLPTGKTWGGTVYYDAATGGQKVMAGTYSTLTMGNTSGTQTASGDLVVTTLNNNTNAVDILDMATFALTATIVNNTGTIITQNTSGAPLPTGQTWGGTVNYDAATGGQTVMAGTYNILTLSNTSGTDTASGAITATTLNTTATGTLDMVTYDLGATNVTSAGNIRTQSVSLTPLPTGKTWGGTVDYDALTGGQTVMAGTYNNLTLSNSSGIDTASGNLIVNGALTTTAGGTLDLTAAYTLSGTLATITNGGTIKTSVPTATSVTPIPSGKTWGGTVEYAAATAQTVLVGTYNDLTFSGAGPKATAAGTIMVNGNWDVNGGTAILNTNSTNVTVAGNISGTGAITSGAGTITVSGDWTNSGVFTSDSGTVTFNGSGTQTIPAFNYYNLISSSTGARTLASSGTIGIAGTFTPGTNVYTVTGSTIEFNGLLSQTSGGTAFPTFNNLIINNSAGVTMTQSQTVNGALTLTSGTLIVGANTLTLAGTSPVITGGDIDVSSATLIFTNSSAIILPASIFIGDVNNLTINGLGGVTASSDFTINGILNLQSVNPSANKGSLDMAGISELTMGNSATTIGLGDVTGIVKRSNFIVDTVYTFGNQYATLTFRPGGTLPTNLSMKISIGSAPAWKTGAVQRIYDIKRTGGSGYMNINHLHYLDSELNGNAENTLVIWDGPTPVQEHGRSDYNTVNNWVGISGLPITYLPTVFGDMEWTMASSMISGATWNGSVSTDWMIPSNWTPGGVPSDLADVTITGATPFDPILSLDQELLVGRLTLNSGAVINSVGNYTITVSGDSGAWSNNGGVFNAGTGTVVFTNTAATISGNTNFYNVTINSGAKLSLESDTFMNISGTMINNGTWDVNSGTNNTVEYNGGSQTVLNPNGTTAGYDNLILSGSGIKTMPATPLSINGNFSTSGTLSAIAQDTLSIGGNFTIGASTLFNAGAFVHTIGGNLTNNGTFISAGGTITLNGILAQAIGGTSVTTFNNLTINNPAGVTLSSINPTIGGILTLTLGNITTGLNNIYINSTGSVVHTSGHVVGNLKKFIATGATSKTFEIGDALNYTPVSISFGTVGTAGNLILSTTSGDHPDIDSSLIHMLSSVNRYWTATNLGIIFDNYSAVFNFVAGDLDVGVDTGDLIVGKWSGALWSYPTVGARTALSTQATGLSSFSDFQLGDANVGPNAPTLVSPADGSTTADNTPTLSSNYSDSNTGDTGTTNYRISSLSATACLNNLSIVAFGASTATLSNNANTTWTPASSIGGNATYYWCAQNNDDVLQSAWISMGSIVLYIAPTGGGGGGGGGGGYIPPASVPTPILLSTGNYSANEALNLSTTINIDNGAIALPAGAISPCVSNSLIKLADDHNPLTQADSSVYYCSMDGRRHAFPNASIYFSWYPSFDNIQIISSQAMAAIPFGLNVTVRPGSRLVKFTTNPKVYAVAPGGALRWVVDEATAVALYGSDWNKWVIDISDAFFTNYYIAGNITLDSVTSGSVLPLASLLVISPATPAQAQCRSDVTFTQDLTLGSSGEQVLALQNLLKCLGHFPSDIVPNGNFGPATETAVKKFQTASNLNPIGSVGPGTRSALNTY